MLSGTGFIWWWCRLYLPTEVASFVVSQRTRRDRQMGVRPLLLTTTSAAANNPIDEDEHTRREAAENWLGRWYAKWLVGWTTEIVRQSETERPKRHLGGYLLLYILKERAGNWFSLVSTYWERPRRQRRRRRRGAGLRMARDTDLLPRGLWSRSHHHTHISTFRREEVFAIDL